MDSWIPLARAWDQGQDVRRSMSGFQGKVGLIWSIAETLRGDYKPSELWLAIPARTAT